MNDTIIAAALSTLHAHIQDDLETYDTKRLVDFVEGTLHHKCRRGGMKEATYRRFLINKIRRESSICLSHQQLAEKGNKYSSTSSTRAVKKNIYQKTLLVNEL